MTAEPGKLQNIMLCYKATSSRMLRKNINLNSEQWEAEKEISL
jgi:hypothetical protein